MAEFQGSFLSFINSEPKTNKHKRNPVPEPKPEVIELGEDSSSEAEPEEVEQQSEERIINSGLYEMIEEKDVEYSSSEGPQSVVMESVRKLVESREEIFRRLETELDQLTHACEDDFLFQITDEEYDGLFKHKATYLSQLSMQVQSWCNKILQLYRVCNECGYKVLLAKEIRDHMKGSDPCKSYYYALGTCAVPTNVVQCQECNYSSSTMTNMRRHQQTKEHKGIINATNNDTYVEGNEEDQQVEQEEMAQEELQANGQVVQDEALQVPVQLREPEEVPAAASCPIDQNAIFNDITMCPKDDDSGGIISDLQSRLEQRVENSDDHFIFRISHEEYVALSQRRAYHMAKFGELVNIYCNKTLKLYQVCDGCGFATFLRKDMIKHFETGTCILSYFNALGTCDDDDPNKDAVEEEAEQRTPIENQFEITEVETAAFESEPTEMEPVDVDRHLKPKIPRTEKKFRCPHCDSDFACIRNKDRHLKHHCPILLGKSATEESPMPQNKQCPQCSKAFQTTIRLNHHIRIVHSEKYKCESCSRKFKHDHQLQKHIHKGCSKAKKLQKAQTHTSKATRPGCSKAKKLEKTKDTSKATPPNYRPLRIQCKHCMIFCATMADLFRHQKSFCKALHMRTAPLVTVIKVEPTRLGGGFGQG